jgi:hypothetical protein
MDAARQPVNNAHCALDVVRGRSMNEGYKHHEFPAIDCGKDDILTRTLDPSLDDSVL